ncbi:thioesterase [Aeromicrobium sp. S22]|uniref:thioesterase family protein n=1 Tax=Aeromicrobium sp. S22 TaxID=2662029 RepID=UPI00129E94F7|nr:thioesterase family protein [Aeromicrobium sp. S22]MRK00281.1 thioesterase [Aeromicrobium sp. S22]
MSLSLPTYDQVLELPAQVDRVVPQEFIDVNGHMNIGRYLEIGGSALWLRCQEDLAMTDDYISSRAMSTFTAEHHLTYYAEILEGEEVSAHVRLVERSDKVLHTVTLIANRTRGQLACVLEATLVHMDMSTRRPTPFPDDVAELIDAGLKSDDLPWLPPLCGAMGVRRRS